MTPHARALATPAHRPLSLPRKKNGRPPRLRNVAVSRREACARGQLQRALRSTLYSEAASIVRPVGERSATHLVADAMMVVATSTCHAVTGGNNAPSCSAEEQTDARDTPGVSGPRCADEGAARGGTARAARVAHGLL